MTEHVISLGCVNIVSKGKKPAEHLACPKPQAIAEAASAGPSWQEKVMVTYTEFKNKIEFYNKGMVKK